MENALCLGTFDGVHIGHRAVLDLPKGYKKIAVTFYQPPKAVITGNCELILTYEQKCRILKAAGIDEISPLKFEDVRDIEAEDFLALLMKEYSPKIISCGYNYNFGKNGCGNVELLKSFCEKQGVILKCADPVTSGSSTVSSTLIRDYIKNGDLEKANKLLFEPFSFEAEVKKGAQRGRTIGFPTINQEYPKELVKLKSGVYKVKVCINKKEYWGIADIGIRPTYPLDYVISETYIKDFSRDLYGKNVKIIPLEFLRGEMRFNSLDQLKEQIEQDINKI